MTTIKKYTPPWSADEKTLGLMRAWNPRHDYSIQALEAVKARRMQSYQHVAPDSSLVAVVGPNYKLGCYQAIVDVVMYERHHQKACNFAEIGDWSYNPYDAGGMMRNTAIQEAQSLGVEWLLMVDADVKPEQDVLTRLLAWDEAIVVPCLTTNGSWDIHKPLHKPVQELNTGLQPLIYAYLAMVLFRMTVFNATPLPVFAEAPMGSEAHFWRRLWQVGHRPRIDTNTQVEMVAPPGYALDVNFGGAKARAKVMKAHLDKRKRPPDRKPVGPDSPFVNAYGEYSPWEDFRWKPL